MNKSELGRIKRHIRSRKKIIGMAEKPRLSVHRSHKNLYAQLIDDLKGQTLLSVSTSDKDIKGKVKSTGNVAAAAMLGELLAARALAQKINTVVFDRGGYDYHGRIKTLADAARKAGLNF